MYYNMSESMNTGSIIYSNEPFYGPVLKDDEHKVNKISCELGEIYYQTKVDEKGLTQVAPGGTGENSNGLFITNDKIQKLIESGNISKYSWLMELVLKGKSNFLLESDAQTKIDKSGKHNASTYYKNGIFVPLKSSDARAYNRKGKNEILFRLPYDDKFRLKLRFNKSKIDTPYNQEDISESVIEHKKDKKNRFGVKEEYQNPDKPFNEGAFFVYNNGTDVTSHIKMCVSNIGSSDDKQPNYNGKAVTYIPTDFQKNKKIEKYWKSNSPKENTNIFYTVEDSQGNIRLKQQYGDLKQQLFYQWGEANFQKQDGAENFLTIEDNNYVMYGKRDGDPTIGGFKIKMIPDTLDVEIVNSPAPGLDELKEFIKQFKNNFLNFKAEKVENTNYNIQKLLNGKTWSLAKEKEKKLGENERDELIFNYQGHNLADNSKDRRIFIKEGNSAKRIKLYTDIDSKKPYYIEYDVGNKKLVGQPIEVGDNTILICGAKNQFSIAKMTDGKQLAIATNKTISNNTATEKNDAYAILNNSDVENLLQGVKQEYSNGQMEKLFKDQNGNPSLAEKVGTTLGNEIQIRAKSNGILNNICTYLPPVAPGQPGKFKLETGETKELNSVQDVTESLEKKDEEAIKTDIEKDKTTVLSEGTLFDFCASQIGATRQQNLDTKEDPIKKKAQDFLRNIRLFAPNHGQKLHINKHMERQMKKINNASGFAHFSGRGRV